MKVRANRAFGTFRRALAAEPQLLQPWSGTVYRVTSLDYPSPESILSGQGSFVHGGRWNARGAFRAVYGSTTDVVAVAETRATSQYAEIPFVVTTPRLLVAIELRLSKLIDLTVVDALRRLGLTVDELRAEDWRKVQEGDVESLTQAIGRAAFESGASGLLVPSVRVPDGVNVVYLPENHGAADEATVCEPEKLARIHGREQK